MIKEIHEVQEVKVYSVYGKEFETYKSAHEYEVKIDEKLRRNHYFLRYNVNRNSGTFDKNVIIVGSGNRQIREIEVIEYLKENSIPLLVGHSNDVTQNVKIESIPKFFDINEYNEFIKLNSSLEIVELEGGETHE